MTKNIIFDLGGVLVDWSPTYLYDQYFETQEAVDYFLSSVCSFDWNEAQDGGRTIEEANRILIDQFPEYKTEILAFYGRWKEMLNGPVQGTLDILTTIKNKDNHKLYALTNWSAETWPIALETFGFLSWFEGILVSGQENIKKPDPKIYHLILDRYQLEAESCLFIDDNLRNIKAAENIGIESIKFDSPEQLKKELIQKGIL